MLRIICFILAAGLAASDACAILNARFENVDNSSALTGYVSQDLYVNTTTGDDWGTAQLLTTLTAGTIYQDPNGSDFAPNPLLFPTFPAVEFDSYVDGNSEQPGIAGAAVNLGGDFQEFSDTHTDITWYNTATDDFGDFTIGRFTLSDDAIGTWTMMVTSTSGFRTYQGQIDSGMYDLRQTGGGPPILGDLDADGFVGIADLNITLGNWNQTLFAGNNAEVGDLDFDGFVGIADLNTVLANWNQFVFPGDTSVGDIDGDGFVGITDLNTVLANWNFQIPIVDARADTDGDGFIGISDLNTVLGDWNAGTPPAAAVPEPASFVTLFGLIGLGLARPRR